MYRGGQQQGAESRSVAGYAWTQVSRKPVTFENITSLNHIENIIFPRDNPDNENITRVTTENNNSIRM